MSDANTVADTTMNYNYVTNVIRSDEKTIVELEPIGDKRKEIEKAAQYAFHRDTSDVRATLIAAGVAELNPNHFHAQSYESRAKDLTVTHELFTADDGLEYVRVIIEVADDE